MDIQFDPGIITGVLSKFEEIAFSYLFGSSEKGIIKEFSDLDVAIYLSQHEEDLETRLGIAKALEEALPEVKVIDLVILNHVGPVLGMQVLRGTLLFVRDDFEMLHAEIYSRICRLYEYDSFWMKKQLEYRGYEVQWSD